MFDIYTILLAVWFAIIALILSELIKQLPYPRIRIILPLMCGIVMGLFLVLLNPQPDLPLLWTLNVFFSPLIVPFFIVGTLQYFEQREGIILTKPLVFSGAFITTLVFIPLIVSGILFRVIPGQVASLFLAASIVVISFVVFFGIETARRVVSGSREDQMVKPDQELVQKNSDVDMKKIVILAVCLLLFSSPYFLMDFLGRHHSSPGQLEIHQLELSEAPDGTVIHLTDEIFGKYPVLESLIKNPHSVQQGYTRKINNKTVNASWLTGDNTISCDKVSQMQNEGLVSPGVYLEYDGNWYTADILHYAGEQC